MRRLILILLSFLIVISLTAGCGKKDKPVENRPMFEPSGYIDVLDKDGTPIGKIDDRAACTACDEGIFYSVFELSETQSTAPAQYHLFRAFNGEDIFFGTLEDQGYEAMFSRTELDAKIYTLALSGNPFDDSPDTLWLLCFDCKAGTMSRHAVSKYGFPYASMTEYGGKLIIMNHEMTAKKRDKLYEFDPQSGKLSVVRSIDPTGEKTDFSLRGVCADKNNLYLLKLRVISDQPAELILETCDKQYNTVSEVSLNELYASTALKINGILGEVDVKNVMGMPVSGFEIVDGKYMFYENFGLVRMIGNLETRKSIFRRDDLYSMSLGSGRPVFYKIDFGFSDDEGERLQIFTLGDGEVENVSFTPADNRNLLREVSISPAGTWVVRTAEKDPRSGGAQALYVWKAQ